MSPSRNNRSTILDLIENRYFGGVASGDLGAVLDCFAEDAEILIRHGDFPERRFSPTPGPGLEDLRKFFVHLCGNYDCWFGNFEHTIDLQEQRAASRFTVRLTPRRDGLYSKFPEQTLMNSNFFEFARDRIKFMLIYYANPAESDYEKPTGYPGS